MPDRNQSLSPLLRPAYSAISECGMVIPNINVHPGAKEGLMY